MLETSPILPICLQPRTNIGSRWLGAFLGFILDRGLLPLVMMICHTALIPGAEIKHCLNFTLFHLNLRHLFTVKMKSPLALLSVLVFSASAVSASAQLSGTGYIVKRFSLRVPRSISSDHRNISLSFDLMDTDSAVNATSFTSCKASWNGTTTGPSDEQRVSILDALHASQF